MFPLGFHKACRGRQSKTLSLNIYRKGADLFKGGLIFFLTKQQLRVAGGGDKRKRSIERYGPAYHKDHPNRSEGGRITQVKLVPQAACLQDEEPARI